MTTTPTTNTAPGGATVLDVRASRRSLVGGCVGNFIEWYEFGVYGYFATVIAGAFFAASGAGDLEALVKTYASFAIAFFFRPVGAWLFGRVGDRVGRRPTLVLVLLLMALGTALIGVLPTRATVGAAAPVLLTLVRILQGLSAGGEFGGAVSLMTEHAPAGRRGLYGSWQSFTVALGLLGGAGTAAVLAVALSDQQLHAWGWRVPFLLALPLGAAALWVRLKVEETPVFRAATAEEDAAEEDTAVRPAAGEAGPGAPTSTGVAILLGILRLMGWAAAGYTFLVVMPSYLQVSLGTSFRESLIAGVIANVGFAASILPAGALSDRVGRRPLMVTGAALIAVLALPMLNLLQAPGTSTGTKFLVVFVAGAIVGLMAGPGPAMLAEMFHTTVRYTGLGVSYSLANAVFAGSAGLIITEVIKRTGNADIPAWYVMATCVVSALACLGLRADDHRRALPR
ncbi:MFS transporter [Oryzihumus leptocrescens]|uniref:Putative proline/betaine transporter n=1 Tax=Oryzihumus leptocrescens TaxID=297536 RepID=A0A542ZHM7_9MICO|nr:MFS transporter [Oryzihumus leptocrescens]TQL59867.1 MFS transporter [Oryzihumus leptocrescens]